MTDWRARALDAHGEDFCEEFSGAACPAGFSRGMCQCQSILDNTTAALERAAAQERERLARRFQDEGHRPIYTDGTAIAAAIRSAK
jgi:hypothetical protein